MVEFIKEVKNNVKKETVENFKDFKKVVESRKDLIIWIINLIIVTVFFYFFIYFFILFYFWFLIKLIFFFIKTFFNKKKYILKVEKEVVIIKKNIYLIFLKQIIINQSLMKSYLLLYMQIDFIKKIKENKKQFKDNIIIILSKIIFRYIFYFLTQTPLIIFKNSNFITEIIKSIIIFKRTTLKNKISNIIFNIIIKYNLALSLKIKNIKIIIKKKKIETNPKKEELEILKNLIDFELWVQSSNNLVNKGIFTQMRYFFYNNQNIPFHPTLFFKNFFSNQYLNINQTTKKNLKIFEEIKSINENNIEIRKKEIELEIRLKKIFKKDGDSYMTMPHLVEEDDIILGDAENLIKKINNRENIITKFKFIQSFFFNFDMKLYKHDPKIGLIMDNNYLNLKDYLIKNEKNFNSEIINEFYKLLEFHEKNKNFIIENRVSFIELLNRAEVDVEIKDYFLKSIEKYI